MIEKISSFDNLKMEVGWALLIWLVIAVVIYLIARHFRVRTWSAIVLALVIATIVLGIIRPPNALAWNLNQSSGLAGLYWLIMFVVPLIALIYVVGKAVTDKEPAKGVATGNAVAVPAAVPTVRLA